MSLLSKLEEVYIFVPEGEKGEIIQRFAERFKPIYGVLRSRSWESLLEELASWAENKGGLAAVIDGFQRLGVEFTSQLQLLADSRLDAPLKLVLLDSCFCCREACKGFRPSTYPPIPIMATEIALQDAFSLTTALYPPQRLLSYSSSLNGLQSFHT